MRYTLSFYFVGSNPPPLHGQYKTKAEAKEMATILAPKEERGGWPGAVKLITLHDASGGKQEDIYCYHTEVMRKAMKAIGS